MTHADLETVISDTAEVKRVADALRRRVFVDEQGVPEDEVIDGLTGNVAHLLITRLGEPVGTARLVDLGSGMWRIGLVAVSAERRGHGLGAMAMRAAMEHIRRSGGREIVLDAQSDASGFYEKLGFVQSGEARAFPSGFVLIPMSFRF